MPMQHLYTIYVIRRAMVEQLQISIKTLHISTSFAF